MAQRNPYDDLPDAKAISDPYDALPDATSDAKPSRFGRGLVRAVGQGATFGFGDEAEARIRSALPGGGTYEEELAKVRAEMKQYGEAHRGTALLAELAGGVALGGGAGALRAGAARAGAGLLAKTAQTAARAAASAPGRLATSGVGQAAIGGFGSAEGDVTDRLKGAVVGGAVGKFLPAVLQKAPVVGRVVRPAAEFGGRVLEKGQRMAANQAERMGMTPLARALEPQDAIRTGRLAAEALPGSLTGPTPKSLAGEATALRAQEGPLRISAAEAAQQAAAAETERAAAMTARNVVRTEGERRLTVAQQRAQERLAKLRGVQTEAKTGAKRVERELRNDLADAQTAARVESKQAAEEAIANARAEAEARFGGVVGDAQGKTAAMQESIRKKQLEIGDQMYGEMSALGQPVAPAYNVIDDIQRDSRLASAAASAEAELLREGKVPTYIQIGEGDNVRQVVSPDVEFLDRMRRRLLYPKLGDNVVGLKLSERKLIKAQFEDLEDKLVNAYSDPKAVRQLVLDTRGKYRGGFELLEAAQLGLDLPRVTAGRASGLLKQSQKELDAVEAMLREKADAVAKYAGSEDASEQALAEAAQNWLDTYRTAAREALFRMREESPDALTLLQRNFATPAGKRRLALALGPDGPALMDQFSKEATGRTAAAAAEAARGRLAPRIESVQQRLATEPAALAERARRAGEVAERVQTVPQAVEQRTAEALTPLQTALQEASAAKRAAVAEERTRRAAVRSTVAQRQAAEAQGKAMAGIGKALRNVEESQTFVNQVLPSLSPEQRAQAREVMGSMLQRRIDELAAQGQSAEQIRRKLMSAERNPAVRALMGEEMARLTRAIRPTESALGAAARGYTGRTAGGYF